MFEPARVARRRAVPSVVSAARSLPSRRLASLACALLIVACGGDEGPSAPGDGGDGPLDLAGQDCLVIVIDATHAAHVSSYGGVSGVSPVLDSLAARGVRFGHVWSNSSWTLPSTASLFTGLYEQTHGVRTSDQALPPVADTLAEVFGRAGYATASFSQNPYTGVEYGLGQGFDDVTMVGPREDEELAERAASFLTDRDDDRPRFAYVHFRRPHAPYDPSAESRALFVDTTYQGDASGAATNIFDHNRKGQNLKKRDIRHLRELYRGSLHDVDARVGELLAGIDRSRTLVVLLSDHGEAFNQHFMLGHNWRSFEEFVSVPLIVSHPDLPAGHVVDGVAQSLDLFPTLAELFALPVDPGTLAGVSQVAALRGGAAGERPAVFTSSRLKQDGEHWMALYDGRFKLMVEQPANRAFLFDLEDDPKELYNVDHKHKRKLERLKSDLERFLAGVTDVALQPADVEGVDEETRQRLRELGYVGDDGG